MRLVLLLLVISFHYCNSQPGLIAGYRFTAGLEDSGPHDYPGSGDGFFTTEGILSFPNDATSHVTIPADAFRGLTDLTISCDVYLNAINEDLNLIFSSATTSTPNYFILYYINGQSLWGFTYKNVNYTFQGTIPKPGRWYCLMLTRVGDTFQFYIDGVKAHDEQVADGDPLQPDNFILGQEQDCFGGCFDGSQNLNGKLDNFSIFNRGLDASEITSGCPEPQLSTAVADLKLPTIVTPNGDGFNDKLQFSSSGRIEIMYLAIYNRWGQRIFYSWSYHNEWDVSSVENGLYYYSFDFNGVRYRSWFSVTR